MMYNIGDECWYIPTGFLLAIKIKIISIDNSNKLIDSKAYTFYELDEPTGHDVAEWELIKIRSEAEATLIVSAFTDFNEEIPINTLTQYRLYKINFIVDTWEDCNDKVKEKRSWFLELPKKKQDEDWFNIENLMK